MHDALEIEYIKQFIMDHEDSKVYLGVDSQRLRKQKVKYATVVVVHFIDETTGVGRGAKIFADVSFEDTRDSDLGRPFNRMMKEVQLITDLFNELEEVLIEKDFEIHIDVNPERGAGSNVAYDAAKWTIAGIIGVEPICKPEAWAASCAADRYSK
jgi:predicted RNase H-related nuclease YkuK (DUF458 family)